VQVVRNGLRSVAFGGARAGLLDLRFMAASADLQVGDLGDLGPGRHLSARLPVAKIVQIERKADTAFSRVYCEPVAGVRSHRQLLVVRYESACAASGGRRRRPTRAERGARRRRAPAPSRSRRQGRRQGSSQEIRGARTVTTSQYLLRPVNPASSR
jgi:rod shape-determining protein MreC